MELELFVSSFAIFNLVFLSIILLHKKPRTLNNKMISYLLIVAAEAIAFNLFIYKGWLVSYPFVLFINYIVIFPCPPVFLYLVNNLLGHERKPFSRKDLVHFIPSAISLVFFVWFYLQPGDYRQHFFLQVVNGEVNPWQMMALDCISGIQTFIYLAICYRNICCNKKTNPNNVNRKWLWYIINFVVIVGLILYIPALFFSASANTTFVNFSIFSIIFYNIFVYEKLKISTMLKAGMPRSENPKSLTISTLPDETRQKLMATIIPLMEDKKIFKDCAITMGDLARLTNTPQYLLTLFLNQCYGKSFPDFINQYRIEEAKKMFASSETQKYSIEVIAEMCGFNSRSAFYTAFKKHTGSSPVQFFKKYSRSA
jgi:AraC-like DNA-binding protein